MLFISSIVKTPEGRMGNLLPMQMDYYLMYYLTLT
jgi:hypothetical protein